MRLVDFLVALSNLIKPQSYLQALITTHKGYLSTHKGYPSTNKQTNNLLVPPSLLMRLCGHLQFKELMTFSFGWKKSLTSLVVHETYSKVRASPSRLYNNLYLGLYLCLPYKHPIWSGNYSSIPTHKHDKVDILK